MLERTAMRALFFPAVLTLALSSGCGTVFTLEERKLAERPFAATRWWGTSCPHGPPVLAALFWAWPISAPVDLAVDLLLLPVVFTTQGR
jgi:hypothetical protein